MSNNDRFMEWQAIYLNQPVESMPWFSPDLDSDLEEELRKRNISKGKFLDLGSGPGTQAAALLKMGFDVTAADISEAAIAQSKRTFPEVNFLQDDILSTRLETKFDYIFDRGCFHVIAPEDRQLYLDNLRKIIQPNGILFLKCFSKLEPETGFGPYRFSTGQLMEIFADDFDMDYYADSAFNGPDGHYRKALFVVLLKK